jgi:hypothetical protein
LEFLNRSLAKLFHNYVRSDAAALLIRKDLTAAFASSGEISLKIADYEVKKTETNQLLGSTEDIIVHKNEFKCEPDSRILVGGTDPLSSHMIQIKFAS